MKILFIGCVESSYVFFQELLNLKDASICGLVTKKTSNYNSDYRDLSALSVENKIPTFFYEKDKEQEMYDFISNLAPDYIYCLGWSHLLSDQVLKLAKKYSVGFHPTLLPKNRGRHPIIWPLVKGETETGSSFFEMKAGADEGGIFSQKKIEISESDYAVDLYKKILDVAKKQLVEMTVAFSKGNFVLRPQNESEATYLRKRTKEDGVIDFNKSAKEVYNLVRALSHPYPGASIRWKNKEYSIWKSEIIESDLDVGIGEVVISENRTFAVKCGSGSILFTQHDLKELPKVGEIL